MILYLPWALQLPAQFAKVGNTYWVARPDISSLFTLLLVFITNIPLPDKLITAALAIVLIVFAAGVFQTIIYTRQTGKKDGLWLLYLSFAPPLFLFLFSQWKPVYVERALLPSGAIFCIWLAWAIRRTSPAKVVQYFLLGLLVISSGLGIFQHVSYHGFPYGPFKELDVSLRERFEAKDVIIHSNKLSCLPAILFDRELSQSFIGDPPGSTTDTLAPATQQVLNVTAEKDIRSAAGDSKRVWYIIYQRSIDEYKASGAATHPDIEYLNSQYNLESTETWDGLQVFLYTKKP